MTEKLGPGTPAPVRIWLLKQLERIGKSESVEAVAAAIGDGDRLVRDAALRALANNPSPTAGDKLKELLRATSDASLEVALINALGFRGQAQSAEPLIPALNSEHAEVAIAAARALGKIASPAAVNALTSALGSTSGKVRLQVGDALAKCADKLMSDGDVAGARSIAQRLYQPTEPARLAGLKASLKTAGADTAAAILSVLSRNDHLESTVAVGFVARVDSKGIKQLAQGLATLTPSAQVALLAALGARRDRGALPAVVAAVANENPAVKTAALAALGGVGDGSTVPLLVKVIQDGGEPAGIARHSLETVFADGVDRALIDVMKQTQDRGRRAEYIEILERRRAAEAIPDLLAEVASDDGNIRRRAIAALGNVAGPRRYRGDGPRPAQDQGQGRTR